MYHLRRCYVPQGDTPLGHLRLGSHLHRIHKVSDHTEDIESGQYRLCQVYLHGRDTHTQCMNTVSRTTQMTDAVIKTHLTNCAKELQVNRHSEISVAHILREGE